MFAALLDTNVLWPSLQRDFLLSLAIEGLYRPLWSDVVLEELMLHEALKLVRRGVAEQEAHRRAAYLLERLTIHFGDAVVTGWEQLGTYGLPDPDDEHVLAAAVLGGAQAIVTDNQRDFPRANVPQHIDVLSARDFARDTVSVDPGRAYLALRQIGNRRGGQPVAALVTVLVERYGMTEVGTILSGFL